MQINHDRIEKYLNDIASEVDDTNSILSRPDEQILGEDPFACHYKEQPHSPSRGALMFRDDEAISA